MWNAASQPLEKFVEDQSSFLIKLRPVYAFRLAKLIEGRMHMAGEIMREEDGLQGGIDPS